MSRQTRTEPPDRHLAKFLARVVATALVVVIGVSGAVLVGGVIAEKGGPKRQGLRAVPVAWPHSAVVELDIDALSVPIPCPYRNYAPGGPTVGFDVGWFGVMGRVLDERPWSTIPPECLFCLGQRSAAYTRGEELCAYRIGDEGWLVVDLIGNYYRVTPDLQRADPLPLLERLALRYGEVPWAATGALLLLVAGAAFALRRRSGYVLRALGVVIAWLWLIPLATFMSRV